MKRFKRQKLLTLASLFVFTFVLNALTIISTSAISSACRNSEACMAAVEAEKSANKKAEEAAATANAYAIEVANKNSEIYRLELAIAESKAQIASLETEISAAEAKLEKDQTALAKLIVSEHFNAPTSDPILILASSDSISDLAEKEAREKTAEEQITIASREVKSLKESLEQKKSQAEALLETQKLSQAELAATRSALESMVAKYSADSAAFSADAEAARQAKIAAEEAEQRAHPELYRGGSYTGVNTYEWQADCPQYQDYYLTYFNGYKIGGYVCECVSYAGWKAYEAYGVYLSWGNAYSWDDYGRASYVVNNIPSSDSIGQSDGGTYGHVFWVEEVNSDGSINITEYNNWYSTGQLTGSYHTGDFGSRTIPAYEVGNYNYIHLDQPL